MLPPTRSLLLLLALVLSFTFFGCAGDDDDDNDDSSPAVDDDAVADDDQSDDDLVDDDDADDDTSPQPESIWDNLIPAGLRIDKIMGIATQMYDGPEQQWERDFEIEKLLDAGLFRLRASIDWPDVEPAQDEFTFDYSDPFLELVIDAGLQFDARLCYGVDWARPEGNDSAIAPEDFGDYAGTVAEHYCGLVDSYEIWNEENLEIFWKPEPDPDHYGKILKAAYTAIHEACPQAKVVFGGLSCFQLATMLHGQYYFLEQVYQAHPDIGQYFDVLAIHPYTFIQTTTPEWSMIVGETELWPNMEGQVRIARERLANIEAEGKPIWFTEWGWPSLIIGDENQGSYLARGALISIAQGIEALDWYTFYNREPGSSSLPTEDYFGLFTHTTDEGGPQEKPAYPVAKAIYQVLGSSRFAGDLAEALALPLGVYAQAYLDEETGAITFAGWTSEHKQIVDLVLPAPVGATQFVVYDQYGEVVAEGGNKEGATLQLSNEVTYVQFAMP